MDHFALPHEALYKAWKEGKLHRNFMGYTTQHTGLLLGLGVSSISDAGFAFAQNDKSLSNYYAAMHAGKLAIRKGYILNEEDQSFRQYILDICCKGKTTFQPKDLPLLQQYSFDKLDALAADGLVEWDAKGLRLTSQGHYFLRNICSVFDLHLARREAVEEKPLFSKAI
ncbi:MAG TPA: coproporphyrinogen III oxidase, partial [Flavisolibacter sp.]|nr:coproporphyrinogen III oxidase [Flavisolibacter sp.]